MVCRRRKLAIHAASRSGTREVECSSERPIKRVTAVKFKSLLPDSSVFAEADNIRHGELPHAVCESRKRKLFLKSEEHLVVVLDKYEIALLSVDNAICLDRTPDKVEARIAAIIERQHSDGHDLRLQFNIFDGACLRTFQILFQKMSQTQTMVR
ncbi:MAG TPA: hypothetical protein VNI77_10490 [Nitrososphaera sp.]|nr:hypothetical protein [Nitrososphaera sp.]